MGLKEGKQKVRDRILEADKQIKEAALDKRRLAKKIVFVQCDFFSVFVKTTFGVSIIFLANAYHGSSGLVIRSDQYETKPSVIFRPRIIVSTGSVNLNTYFLSLSSQFEMIQSNSSLVPAM